MKVTGWTCWDHPDYTDICHSVDSMALRYSTMTDAKKTVIDELRTRKYKFSGIYHQGGDYGVPIIDGKWLFQCSQRSWGEIMAKAYGLTVNGDEEYAYALWSWHAPEEMVLPKPEDYDE